ncbi:MAG: aminotransferase class I/II-fold pyridoxal phosphate-dependent enzyme [Magnetococcus sp. DMHC-6]
MFRPRDRLPYYRRKMLRKLWRLGQAVIKGEVTAYPDFVIAFEASFARWVGRSYGVSFCNGTSSLEAALFAVGVRPGDEVLTPGYTIHLSLGIIHQAGAKPVLVDIDSRTLTMDPEDLERKITPASRAILVVHMWANPNDMRRIMAIAKRHQLKVVEDCSHAHGSTLDDRKVGSWGDVGCFSLQGSKPIAAGEGGMAVTDADFLYHRMMLYGHFGRLDGLIEAGIYPQVRQTGLGTKRRAHPLGICLASVDLEYVDRENLLKRQRAKQILEVVSRVPGLLPVQNHPGAERGGFYLGLPVLVDDSFPNAPTVAQVLKGLHAHGIGAKPYPYGVYHRMAHLLDLAYRLEALSGPGQPVLPSGFEFPLLPVTEMAQRQTFLLPLFEFLGRDFPKGLSAALHEVMSGGGG